MIEKFQKLGLKQKFVGVAFILFLIISIFVSLFFPMSQGNQMKKYLRQKAMALAQMASYSSSAGLVFEDKSSINNALEGLKYSIDVEFAVVLQEDDSVFTSYQVDEVAQKEIDEAIQTYKEGQDVFEQGNKLIVTVPITSGKDTIGHLMLGVSKENLNSDVRNSQMVAIFSGFGILIIGCLIFYVLTARLVGPINIAVRVANQLAEGNIRREFSTGSEVEDSNDEVDQLLGAMKRMVQYIKNVSAVAQKLAVGNINVKVELRSEYDTLNKSFSQTISYIKEVANIAENIANGELDVDITPKSDEDILNNSFKKMNMNLRQIIQRLSNSSEKIAQTASQLTEGSIQISKGAEQQSQATDETSASMEEMATSIQEVATNSDNLSSNVSETSASIEQMATSIQAVSDNTADLSASVDQTSSAIEEMAASIEQVAENAKQVSNSTESAVTEAQEGGKAVNKTITGMQNISETMKEIVVVIEKLNESSKKINSIVDVIDDIAEQTNLLALNAQIEAARAGEHGRGFAVVADEVRKLAERSASSAKEIVDLISDVQKDTENAIVATKQGSDKVEEGVELASQAGEVLDRIEKTVSNVNRMMREISKATDQQARASEQIVKTMDNMRNITQQVDTASKEQARGSEQIMKAVDVMNKMTQQVSSATKEQKNGGERIVRAIENIAAISRQNTEIANAIVEIVEDLNQQSEDLHKITNSFSLE